MGGILLNLYEEEEREEKEFWEQMRNDEGYISSKCPNCGRIRVIHWSCGKDICEKCKWCIQDKAYFINRFFEL